VLRPVIARFPGATIPAHSLSAKRGFIGRPGRPGQSEQQSPPGEALQKNQAQPDLPNQQRNIVSLTTGKALSDCIVYPLPSPLWGQRIANFVLCACMGFVHPRQ